MIDGIRRRLGKAEPGEPWNADEGLKPEIGESEELPGDTGFSEAANQASGQYSPDGTSAPDFYKSLVQTAIDNGGKHGYHRISIPWLRMILAGLELKHVEPEMMWYGVEAAETKREPMSEIPPYEDLFQPTRRA